MRCEDERLERRFGLVFELDDLVRLAYAVAEKSGEDPAVVLARALDPGTATDV